MVSRLLAGNEIPEGERGRGGGRGGERSSSNCFKHDACQMGNITDRVTCA